jgi:hypothetical protein
MGIAVQEARVELARLEAKPEAERFHYSTKPNGSTFITSDNPKMALLRAQIDIYEAHQQQEATQQ